MRAMKTALRVLTRISERRTPDPEDVAELRTFLPERDGIPPDELACEVIQQALKQRSDRRSRTAEK